jgi:hypothetical protein
VVVVVVLAVAALELPPQAARRAGSASSASRAMAQRPEGYLGKRREELTGPDYTPWT